MSAPRVLVVLTDGDPALARHLDDLRRAGWRVLATVRMHAVKALLTRNEGATFLVRSSILPKGKENDALKSCAADGKRPYTILSRSVDFDAEVENVDFVLSEPFEYTQLISVLNQATGEPSGETVEIVAKSPEGTAPSVAPEIVAPTTPSLEAMDALSATDATKPIGEAEVRLLRWIRRCTELERDKPALRQSALQALVNLTASSEGRLFINAEKAPPILGETVGVSPSASDLDRVMRYAGEAMSDKTPRLIMGVPRDGVPGSRVSYLVVPLRHVDAVPAVAILSGRDPKAPYGAVDLEVADHLGRQFGENFANAERQVELETWALIDSRTELYSQKFYERNFAKSFYNAKRHGESLSLMLIDLDFFKQVNESLGYEGGNQVLKRVAQLLNVSFRTGDLVCRWGGDEFIVILPKSGKSPDEGRTLAERIRASVANLRIDVKANSRTETISPTVSIGYATFPTHAKDEHALFQAANAALTRAKRIRNTVCLAEPERESPPTSPVGRLGHAT